MGNFSVPGNASWLPAKKRKEIPLFVSSCLLSIPGGSLHFFKVFFKRYIGPNRVAMPCECKDLTNTWISTQPSATLFSLGLPAAAKPWNQALREEEKQIRPTANDILPTQTASQKNVSLAPQLGRILGARERIVTFIPNSLDQYKPQRV